MALQHIIPNPDTQSPKTGLSDRNLCEALGVVGRPCRRSR